MLHVAFVYAHGVILAPVALGLSFCLCSGKVDRERRDCAQS